MNRLAETPCGHPFQAYLVPRLPGTCHKLEFCAIQRLAKPQRPNQVFVAAQVTDERQETSRRSLLAASLLASLVLEGSLTRPAVAVQGLTAGRLPGVSKEKDAEGFRTYRRPDGKSGGHGVGWSEIPQYTFKVPDGWKEVPVSIADLGGTEIDLRFGNEEEGGMAVVVAPVLRFLDVGFNSDVRIQELGSPEKLISGFGPELFGGPIQEGEVMNTQVVEKNGLTFYQWELKPHRLVAATAYKNRVFLMALVANGRQWRKSQATLRKMQESFGLAGVTV